MSPPSESCIAFVRDTCHWHIIACPSPSHTGLDVRLALTRPRPADKPSSSLRTRSSLLVRQQPSAPALRLSRRSTARAGPCPARESSPGHGHGRLGGFRLSARLGRRRPAGEYPAAVAPGRDPLRRRWVTAGHDLSGRGGRGRRRLSDPLRWPPAARSPPGRARTQ